MRSKLPKMARLQHDGPLARAVLGHIVRVEPLGQHEIDLQRAALPVAADRVAQDELELWGRKRRLRPD